MKRGRPIGIKRDWPAIIADAKARDLKPEELAKEQGVLRNTVYRRLRQHGAMLRHGLCKLDWHKALLDAAVAGDDANAFCRKHDVSFNTLELAERRHGVRLPRPRESKRSIAA